MKEKKSKYDEYCAKNWREPKCTCHRVKLVYRFGLQKSAWINVPLSKVIATAKDQGGSMEFLQKVCVPLK